MNRVRDKRKTLSPWPPLLCSLVLLVCGSIGAREYFKTVPAIVNSIPFASLKHTFAFFIEAEETIFRGEITFDSEASGGSVVQSSQKSQSPLLLCVVPPCEQPLDVWVRRKGGPIIAQDQTGNSLSGASTSVPTEPHFTWTLMGKINPSSLASALYFQETGEKDEPTSVDCLLFTDRGIEDKDAHLTELAHIQPEAKIKPPVEEATRTLPSVRGEWGINLSESSSTNPQTALCISPPNWDEEPFRELISQSLEQAESTKMIIQFPVWPEAMDNEGLLDQKKLDDYIDLVLRFISIAFENPSASSHLYFALLSGVDQAYYNNFVEKKEPHRIAELSRNYLSLVNVIRQVEPSAKLGGIGADLSTNPDFHRQFIASTAPSLDFYSVYSPVHSEPETTDTIGELLKKNSVGREIPLVIFKAH